MKRIRLILSFALLLSCLTAKLQTSIAQFNGTFNIYSNSSATDDAGTWSISGTYDAGDKVSYNSDIYVSLQGSNVGNQPDTESDYWTAIDYYVEAFFNDPSSFDFQSTNSAVGDEIFTPNCDRYQIAYIHSNTGSIIKADLIAMDGAGIPGNFFSAIFRPTPNNSFPEFPANLSEVLRGCLLTHFAGMVDTAASSVSLEFDGDRQILRVPTAGENLGTATVTEWLEWWYFTAPTISLSASPSTQVYEIGTTNSINLTTTVNNDGGSTLSNGELTRTVPASNVVTAFGTATSDVTNISFTPIQTPVGADYTEQLYSFSSSQDWTFGTDGGTATSGTITINGIYPVFYGMSATDFSTASGTTLYDNLTKLVSGEGNKTVSLTGTNAFIYYAIPTTWDDTDLSQILDDNGFNILTSFTVYDVTVSSTGLDNDYSNVSYKLYKLNNLTTLSGPSYQFIR